MLTIAGGISLGSIGFYLIIALLRWGAIGLVVFVYSVVAVCAALMVANLIIVPVVALWNNGYPLAAITFVTAYLGATVAWVCWSSDEWAKAVRRNFDVHCRRFGSM
jgi:hypothetical protein